MIDIPEKLRFVASSRERPVQNAELEAELRSAENICWNIVLGKENTREVYLEDLGNLDQVIDATDFSNRSTSELELRLRQLGFIDEIRQAEGKVISLQNAIPDFNEPQTIEFIKLIPTLNFIENFRDGASRLAISMIYNSLYGLSILDFPSIFVTDYDPRSTLDETLRSGLERDLIVIMHLLLAPKDIENDRVKEGLRKALSNAKNENIDIDLILQTTEKLNSKENIAFREVLETV